MTNMNILRSFRLPSVVVMGLAGALVLTACGGETTTPNTPTTASAAPNTSSDNPDTQDPHVQFTDLGGGASIATFRGPGDSSTDRVLTGRFYKNGDTVPVICQTEGRLEKSNPAPSDETPATSDIWYNINRGGEFASAVYTTVVPPNAVVPKC